jgi:hypothetical protein
MKHFLWYEYSEKVVFVGGPYIDVKGFDRPTSPSGTVLPEDEQDSFKVPFLFTA